MCRGGFLPLMNGDCGSSSVRMLELRVATYLMVLGKSHFNQNAHYFFGFYRRQFGHIDN